MNNSKGISSMILLLGILIGIIAIYMILNPLSTIPPQNNTTNTETRLEADDQREPYTVPAYVENRYEDYVIDENHYEGEREDYNMKITYYSYNNSRNILTIHWDFDDYIKNYTDNIYIGLTGYDKNHEIIDAKDNDNNSYGYAYYGEHYPVKLGSTLVENGAYSFNIPQNLTDLYERAPDFYFIRMFAVDERKNSHEWAGEVGWADIGPIYLNN